MTIEDGPVLSREYVRGVHLSRVRRSTRGRIDADQPRGRFGRRRLLRWGIGGGVAIGVGGILAWQTSGYEVPRSVAERLRALRPKEYLVVEAAADRILRSDRPDDPTARDVSAALFVDAYVASLDDAQRSDLTRLLHLLEHGLPIAAGKLGRFTRLDGEAQDAVLRAMMTSSVGMVRGAFDVLKALCAMAYYRDARTWRAIGYDGPWVGRPPGGFG